MLPIQIFNWISRPQVEFHDNAGGLVSALVTPSADQIARFLQCGSHSAYALWQCTFTFRLPSMSTGVDCSVSRGSLADYDAMYNFAAGNPPTPPPPPPAGDWQAAVADLRRASQLANDIELALAQGGVRLKLQVRYLDAQQYSPSPLGDSSRPGFHRWRATPPKPSRFL